MRLKLAVAALVAAGAGGCYIVATPDGVGVGIHVRPVYTRIAGTGIRVVTNAPGDVFYYGGTYYRWYGGRWWRSPTWRSGWTPITVVPRVFLSIPRTHRMYRVARHHPLHPAHPPRPTHPAHPVHPARPAHAVGPARPVPAPGRAKIQHKVREAAKERAKKEKEKKEKEKKPKRGGR